MSGSSERPLLALEASTQVGTIALGTRDGLLAEVAVNVRSGHSSTMMTAVEYALGATGVDRSQLGGVVVGSGPGSFTGLRIAAATAKGIVHALRIPFLGYSSLLAAAAQAWAADGAVCALLDARGRDVFAGAYRFADTDFEVLHPAAVLSLDEVIDRYRAAEPPLFLGEGAIRHAEELRRSLGARVAPPHFAAPRAAALVWLAVHHPASGRIADAAAWEPDYLRASGAERIAAARRAEPGT